MNIKKISISIGVILVLFVIAMKLPEKKAPVMQELAKQPIAVSVKLASDSKSFIEKSQFPASIVGEQEVRITAKSAGTIMVAPGNIGTPVSVGSLLAKIDDTGALDVGDNGLRNLQVQQAQNSVDQAKKAYSLAKDNYSNLKKSDTATRAEKDNAKTQRDIAKLQYESAMLGLDGIIDNHSITSPISGAIINKAVSVGDSVSVGQLIAIVSKSSLIEFQFYVNQDQRAALTRGQIISTVDSEGNTVQLNIQNISAAADPVTKSFLIEACPKKHTTAFLSGTIATVFIESTLEPTTSANFLLPLSALSISQNNSSIYVVENNIAKKKEVTVIKVTGEVAEISTDISPETRIITDNNKLVHDGEAILIQD